MSASRNRQAKIMRRRRPHQITVKPPKAYILGKEGVGKSGQLNYTKTLQLNG